MTREIQILAWDRHKNVVRLNWLMGSQPFSLHNLISNNNTDINKQQKPAQLKHSNIFFGNVIVQNFIQEIDNWFILYSISHIYKKKKKELVFGNIKKVYKGNAENMIVLQY